MALFLIRYFWSRGLQAVSFQKDCQGGRNLKVLDARDWVVGHTRNQTGVVSKVPLASCLGSVPISLKIEKLSVLW